MAIFLQGGTIVLPRTAIGHTSWEARNGKDPEVLGPLFDCEWMKSGQQRLVCQRERRGEK